MDIAVYTNSYPPQQCPTAETVAANVEELRRLGHRVLVVAPALQGEYRREPWVVRFPVDRVTNGRPALAEGEVPAGFSASLVHAYDPFVSGVLALRHADGARLPLVYSPSLIYLGLLDALVDAPVFLERIADALATRFAGLADQVVAPNPAVLAQLERRGLRVPMTVVPAGVSSFWNQLEGDDEARVRRGGGFHVGVLGRLADDTRASTILDVLEAYLRVDPDATGVIAGAGPDLRAAQDRAAMPGLTGRVRILTPHTRCTVKNLLRDMDALLVASRVGRAFGWRGPAAAGGVTAVDCLDPSRALETLRDLAAESPAVRAARRKANAAATVDAAATAAEYVRLYKSLLLGPKPGTRPGVAELTRNLAGASPKVAAAWEELDLRDCEIVRLAA